MYVINVHGLRSNAFKEAGTEKKSRAFPDISGLLSRKPITTVIVIRRNTAMLIYNKPGKIASVPECLFNIVPYSHQYKVFVVFLQYLIRRYPNSIPPR